MSSVPKIVVFLVLISKASGFAAIALGGAAAAGMAALLTPKVYCRYKECCTSTWIKPDLPGLKTDLDNKVFGQHIATKVVYNLVKGHVENPNPKKALVLSFHGWTGSGKNHVSNIIAKNLYRKGMNSAYTHQLVATKDFVHKDKVLHYKEVLQNFVKQKVQTCPLSMFIFDEVDKIPEGVLDALKPFLDHHHKIDGVDYRKSIFIFISNTGAHLINNVVLEHWNKGLLREDITMKEMDKIIDNGAFNLEGGFWLSDLISSNLIDVFVPFLPLEREHVKRCIEADLKAKNKRSSEENVNLVAKELQYFPEREKVFSKSGCKKVGTRVNYVVPAYQG